MTYHSHQKCMGTDARGTWGASPACTCWWTACYGKCDT